MIDEHKELFISLKNKINKIISLYEKIKEEKEDLLQKKEELLNNIKEKEKEIKNWENKYEKIKLSGAFLTTSKDAHEAKIKINRIVREIDYCIALLNK